MLEWKQERNGRYAYENLVAQMLTASGYNSHKSLDEFCIKFSDRIDRRYLAYTKDLKKDGQTLLLPIYMVPLL